jgi:hypothetical protein
MAGVSQGLTGTRGASTLPPPVWTKRPSSAPGVRGERYTLGFSGFIPNGKVRSEPLCSFGRFMRRRRRRRRAAVPQDVHARTYSKTVQLCREYGPRVAFAVEGIPASPQAAELTVTGVRTGSTKVPYIKELEAVPKHIPGYCGFVGGIRHSVGRCAARRFAVCVVCERGLASRMSLDHHCGCGEWGRRCCKRQSHSMFCAARVDVAVFALRVDSHSVQQLAVLFVYIERLWIQHPTFAAEHMARRQRP